MKALSLWQPWASAMAFGWKTIETRHWPTRHRGLLAIHAAQRWTSEEKEAGAYFAHLTGDDRLAKPPLGCIVAIGRLEDCHPVEHLAPGRRGHPQFAIEYEMGNYTDGRFGFVFDMIRALPKPIPFRGMQGLFDVPDHLFDGL